MLNVERVGATASKICSPPLEADELSARRPLKPMVDPPRSRRVDSQMTKFAFADCCEPPDQFRHRLGPRAHQEHEAIQQGIASHAGRRHVVLPIGFP